MIRLASAFLPVKLPRVAVADKRLHPVPRCLAADAERGDRGGRIDHDGLAVCVGTFASRSARRSFMACRFCSAQNCSTAILRGRIESGEYAPGQRLPSITGLVQEYGIARTTAA